MYIETGYIAPGYFVDFHAAVRRRKILAEIDGELKEFDSMVELSSLLEALKGMEPEEEAQEEVPQRQLPGGKRIGEAKVRNIKFILKR